MQPVEVDALVAEYDHQRGVADGVEGGAALAAVGDRLAQGAPAGRLGGPSGEPQSGGGEGGEALRVDRLGGVRRDEQSVGGGDGRIGYSVHLFTQVAHFHGQRFVVHALNSPMGF